MVRYLDARAAAQGKAPSGHFGKKGPARLPENPSDLSTMCIEKVPEDWTEEDVRRLLHQQFVKGVASIDVIGNGKVNLGFKKPDDAQKAVRKILGVPVSYRNDSKKQRTLHAFAEKGPRRMSAAHERLTQAIAGKSNGEEDWTSRGRDSGKWQDKEASWKENSNNQSQWGDAWKNDSWGEDWNGSSWKQEEKKPRERSSWQEDEKGSGRQLKWANQAKRRSRSRSRGRKYTRSRSPRPTSYGRGGPPVVGAAYNQAAPDKRSKDRANSKGRRSLERVAEQQINEPREIDMTSKRDKKKKSKPRDAPAEMHQHHMVAVGHDDWSTEAWPQGVYYDEWGCEQWYGGGYEGYGYEQPAYNPIVMEGGYDEYGNFIPGCAKGKGKGNTIPPIRSAKGKGKGKGAKGKGKGKGKAGGKGHDSIILYGGASSASNRSSSSSSSSGSSSSSSSSGSSNSSSSSSDTEVAAPTRVRATKKANKKAANNLSLSQFNASVQHLMSVPTPARAQNPILLEKKLAEGGEVEVCTAPMPVAAPPMPISEVAGVMKDVAPHENIPAELVSLWEPRFRVEANFDIESQVTKAKIIVDMNDVNLKDDTLEQWCHWASLQIWNAQANAQGYENEDMAPPIMQGCILEFSKNDIGDRGANILLKWTRDMQMQIDCLRLNNCSITDSGLKSLLKHLHWQVLAIQEIHLADNELTTTGFTALLHVLHVHKDYPRISVNDEGEHRYVPTFLGLTGNDLGDREALMKSELDADLVKRLCTMHTTEKTLECSAFKCAKSHVFWKKGGVRPDRAKAIVAHLPGFPAMEPYEPEPQPEHQPASDCDMEGSDAGPTPILDPTVNFEPEELYEEDSAITDQVMDFCPEGEPIDESAAVMQQPVPFMHVEAQEVLQYMTNVPEEQMNFEPNDPTVLQSERMAEPTQQVVGAPVHQTYVEQTYTAADYHFEDI